MLKRLRDKRGAVMESALLFLLVVFLLCFLLTLVALGGHASTEIAEVRLAQRLQIEQIAEDFTAYAKKNADPLAYTLIAEQAARYDARVDNNGTEYTLTVLHKGADPAEPSSVLLSVKLDVAGALPTKTVTVLAYRYGALA